MNPQDLLTFAETVVDSEPTLQNSSILRRAVSTAYYALFHLLTSVGSQKVSSIPEYRLVVARKYDHGPMKKVADRFSKLNLDELLKSLADPFPPELSSVAEAFVDLQNLRHRADYDADPARDFSPAEARVAVERVKTAFAQWQLVATTPAAEIFLLTMLFDFPRRA